jgi:hypothetical protein
MYHDNVLGVHVGTMTVHRNGTIVWDQTTESPDTMVAYVHANYNKAGQRVRLDVVCKGDAPDWVNERIRQVMMKSMHARRRELEKQYHLRREEKIKGKMRRYNRLA